MNTPSRSIPRPPFSPDYRLARRRFHELTRQHRHAPARETRPCSGRGPHGEPLSTDVAWLGPADASRVLVLISATHGVEGFAGSAIQCDWLAREQTLPADTAMLLVHALNPWGFAWLRRCDAEGIDLNRNFVDFRRPPDNPGYRELREVLRLPVDEQRAYLNDWQTRHGRTALEIAVSGGQYLDPEAPFFGGFGPAHGRRVVEWLMRRYRLARRRLAVVDIHTGLGRWAEGEIICDHAPDSGGARTARRWYGDEVTLPAAGTSSSVPKLGLLDYAWHRIMDHNSCFVTLEFGTYSTDRLLEVLLDDHHRHRSGAAGLAGQDAMREHFAPDSEDWRQRVLARGRTVIDRALEGLNH